MAEPAAADGWLGARVETVGASPCAFLLGCADLDAARERFPVEVNPDAVVLDANHPLANEAVTFRVKVIGVHQAP